MALQCQDCSQTDPEAMDISSARKSIQVALMAVLLLKCCDRCYKDHEPHYCQHYIQYYHWYVSSTMIYDKTHQNNTNNNT